MLNIGNTIKFILKTDSTNKYTTKYIAENEPESGTVFLAYKQTDGKGHMNNRWESEAGMNLTFSIFLKPDFITVYQQYMISKIVCLGIKSFIERFVNESVTIKWPNDIYVGSQKICGILIENAVMDNHICHSIVGIGLNINQMSFSQSLPNPVSLKMITGKDYKTEELLTLLLNDIDHFYELLKTSKNSDIDASFEQSLYLFETIGMFKDANHEFHGTIKGVNDIGQLMIEKQNGTVNFYHFKEVVYIH